MQYIHDIYIYMYVCMYFVSRSQKDVMTLNHYVNRMQSSQGSMCFVLYLV